MKTSRVDELIQITAYWQRERHRRTAPNQKSSGSASKSVPTVKKKNSFWNLTGEREESDVVPNSLTAIMDQTEATVDEQEA